MTKPSVTPEKMLEELDRDIYALSGLGDEFGETLAIKQAIRFLILDYPRLQARYDALRRKVEEWKKLAGEIKDVDYSGKDWDIPSNIIRQLRDFEEE